MDFLMPKFKAGIKFCEYCAGLCWGGLARAGPHRTGLVAASTSKVRGICRQDCFTRGSQSEALIIRLIAINIGQFPMVSQPIRLNLVDWFVFHFV